VQCLHLHLRPTAGRGATAEISTAASPSTPRRYCCAASNAKCQGGLAETRRVGDQILVHSDSPITSIADLTRGKKSIASAGGASAHGLVPGQAQSGTLNPGRRALVSAARERLSAFLNGRPTREQSWIPTRAGRPSTSTGASRGQAKDVTHGYWFGIASYQASGRRRNAHRTGRPAGALLEGGRGQGATRTVGPSYAAASVWIPPVSPWPRPQPAAAPQKPGTRR